MGVCSDGGALVFHQRAVRGGGEVASLVEKSRGEVVKVVDAVLVLVVIAG